MYYLLECEGPFRIWKVSIIFNNCGRQNDNSFFLSTVVTFLLFLMQTSHMRIHNDNELNNNEASWMRMEMKNNCFLINNSTLFPYLSHSHLSLPLLILDQRLKSWRLSDRHFFPANIVICIEVGLKEKLKILWIIDAIGKFVFVFTFVNYELLKRL